MLSAVAVPALLASLLSAPVPVDPPQPHLDWTFRARGAGCPAGTVQAAPREDNAYVYVGFQDFTVRAGAGADPAEARKRCEIIMRMDVPADYAFAVDNMAGGATVDLPAGARSSLLMTAQVRGGEPIGKPGGISGPIAKPVPIFPYDVEPVFGPCGSGRLKIVVEAAIENVDPEAFPGSTISLEHPQYVSTAFRLRWKRC